MELFERKIHEHKPQNVNKQHQSEQGFNERIAVVFTRWFGTMFAFYILVAWMFIWMGLATLGVGWFVTDKWPFPFLLFCSNLIQLWALPVLAVGQNVLSRKAELQAEEQFNTTIKTYHDIEQIMKHLEAQDEELLRQTEMLKGILGKTAKP